MNKYTIYCTPSQAKKALELGAPIEYANNYNAYLPHKMIDFVGESGKMECAQFVIPTADQMIGWLEEQGIWIHFCKPNQRPTLLSFSVSNINDPFRRIFVGEEYIFRKEATLAAIDAALEHLENNRK